MADVQVESSILGKKPVHTIGGGHYLIRLFFDVLLTQGRLREMTGQKRKRFMALVITR